MAKVMLGCSARFCGCLLSTAYGFSLVRGLFGCLEIFYPVLLLFLFVDDGVSRLGIGLNLRARLLLILSFYFGDLLIRT